MTRLGAWKFRLLLVALLALLITEPFLGRRTFDRLCYTMLWTVMLIGTIYAISDVRWQRYAGLGFGVPIILGLWSRHLFSARTGEVFTLPFLGLAVVFLAVVAILLMRHLVTSDVHTDNVAGAVCAYLFLGIAIGVVYSMIETVRPNSFQGSEKLVAALGNETERRAALTYFSFVTLTTAGYGDLAPATPLTRVLAALEAILGQFYLAVLVAGLVGIGVSRHSTGAKA